MYGLGAICVTWNDFVRPPQLQIKNVTNLTRQLIDMFLSLFICLCVRLSLTYSNHKMANAMENTNYLSFVNQVLNVLFLKK